MPLESYIVTRKTRVRVLSTGKIKNCRWRPIERYRTKNYCIRKLNARKLKFLAAGAFHCKIYEICFKFSRWRLKVDLRWLICSKFVSPKCIEFNFPRTATGRRNCFSSLFETNERFLFFFFLRFSPTKLSRFIFTARPLSFSECRLALREKL